MQLPPPRRGSLHDPSPSPKTQLRFLAANPELLSSPRSIAPVVKQQPEKSPKPKHVADELWDLISNYLPDDPTEIQRQIINHLQYTLARGFWNSSDDQGLFQSTSLSTRDRLIERWNDTQMYHTEINCKRVYYLSIEFLLGRALRNAILNLELEDGYREALEGLGGVLENIYEQEQDPGLGNGGLGRLAACFMDSMATQNYPAWGYGIRYTYGMFKQTIRDGFQHECPDFWLVNGNPWEIQRNDIRYNVRFGGTIAKVKDINGNIKFRWEGGEQVVAVAYDTLIPGYGTKNTLNIRLWSSRPCNEFDLDSFNRGDYYGLIEQRQNVENITSVLYPNDHTPQGKLLRLKQQYFFCSATLHDIIRRHRKKNPSLANFHQQVAMQLNDTHPTIAIVELMRLLMDEEGMGWDQSWHITENTFAYTNHTVMPEALESWSVDLLQSILPRHLQIIYEVNRRFLEKVQAMWPHDWSRQERMSIFVDSGSTKYIRMANLAIIGSHSVNGVARIHSEIIKKDLFKDFHEFFPTKFTNVTNGVAPRRWLLACNPGLADRITSLLGSDEWVGDLSKLADLKKYVDNEDFQHHFWMVKTQNKERVKKLILECTNGAVEVNTNALFDMQIKRIHEYKRQLLNILGVIHRYLNLKKMKDHEFSEVVGRVFIFGGKAAPAYHTAKLIIKLINAVSDVVNNDKSIHDLLKVVFIPNYNVTTAEKLIPGSDISEHISTAGTEASGTSNMKFAMNGGLIIGTLDGANVEIMEEIGAENIFIFGTKATDVAEARGKPHAIDSRLYEVLKAIESGMFGFSDLFKPLIDQMWNGNDYYLVSTDFASYVDTQNLVDQTYKNRQKWVRMCISSTAGMGKFSSDRSIKQYAQEIWNVQPSPVPDFE